MSRTYKATGINLKSMPLGEADRLVTILTPEFGLIRVVAPGARKQNSQLAGRTGLFVVNQLLIAKGRSLDKITQAETLESYPGLSKDLSKLAASQYLAELVLCHALSEHPQAELYELLNEHLRRLEKLPSYSGNKEGASLVLAHLSHGIFHLLALAGIAPQVQVCCITQHPLHPNFTDPTWQVGFSVEVGGVLTLAARGLEFPKITPSTVTSTGRVGEATSTYHADVQTLPPPRLNGKLDALELTLFQQLAAAQLPDLRAVLPHLSGHLSDSESVAPAWVKVERMLRDYTQYHFGRSIRSAALVDALSVNK
ncbi:MULTISPECIES: DNA repair protein RecO [unclassified Coleofasciculus]|uniref:DNA repair protein RecO n=1 Tax=unclassified Coleofasciculus TaxID=2692782 RepID=UPI00187F0BFF|nr:MULTISPECIES: DNA repair protein RecO [unclassified Coleofasciculus]MBE9130025.1 DNA repair protein RecO [Coleofasciculus sp. LEGE 07081]MBE9150812.1 DNA repair protein RecO [Coleofasciculus sp. LEGE 07092]